MYGRIIVQINVSCLPYYQSQLTHQVLKSMCTQRTNERTLTSNALNQISYFISRHNIVALNTFNEVAFI